MSPRRARAGVVSRHAARLAVFPASVLACAAAACNNTSDCFGIHPGNRIEITVVEVYEENMYATGFPCPGFDITPGITLMATDLANPSGNGEGDTCNSAEVGIDSFAGWTWTPASMSTGSDPTVLTGSFNASNGTCAGHVSIDVKLTSSGDPFVASEAGQPPHLVMQRAFTAEGDGGAGCPHACMDTYSVDLERL